MKLEEKMNIKHKQQNTKFAEMTLWFESLLGQALLESERALLEDLLPRRFGYHLLQLGCSDIPMYDSSPIGHKFAIAMDGSAQGQALFAEGESLPFANESVDLVLLHHALDYSGQQHKLLREVSRVLIEGGQVIIVGFNPFSTWGLRNKLQWHKNAPWHGQSLGTRRLTDWLKLLEFQVEQIKHGAYCLPINAQRVIKYSSFFDKLALKLNWPTGGVYAIAAKKEAIPLTPIQQPWRDLKEKHSALTTPEHAAHSSHAGPSNKETIH